MAETTRYHTIVELTDLLLRLTSIAELRRIIFDTLGRMTDNYRRQIISEKIYREKIYASLVHANLAAEETSVHSSFSSRLLLKMHL